MTYLVRDPAVSEDGCLRAEDGGHQKTESRKLDSERKLLYGTILSMLALKISMSGRGNDGLEVKEI